MEILFIVPYVPSLVRVRPFNLIRALTANGHQVTVLTLWTSEQEKAELEALRRECAAVYALALPLWRSLWNMVCALPRGVPLQSLFAWHPELLGLVHPPAMRPFDVVHVEHLRGVMYGLELKQKGYPVVWDSVDCITHLFEQTAVQSQDVLGRWRSTFDLKRTARYEGWLTTQFDRVLVTSAADQKALMALHPDGRSDLPITVLTNGVDLDYFCPDPALPRDPHTVVVSGKMSYHANVTMVLYLLQEIMPLVWAKQPEVKVWVVGKDPKPELVRWGEHPQVLVTGEAEDIRPFLRRATMAVAPVRYGAGIQNKVLEAMACGTPVIASPTAVSALQLTPNQEVVIANGAEAFAQAILALLSDSEKHAALIANGRRYVETHHRWPAIAHELEHIYQSLRRIRQKTS